MEFRIVSVATGGRLTAMPIPEDVIPVFALAEADEPLSRWRFIPLDGGVWEIQHMATGRALGVESEKGVPVSAYPPDRVPGRHWRLEREPDGWRIASVAGGGVLTAEPRDDRKAAVVRRPFEGFPAQLWRLERADEGGNMTKPVSPEGKPAIEGRVVDAASGKGVPEVEVRLYRPPEPGPIRSAMTGPYGGFVIFDLPDGKYDAAVEPRRGFPGAGPVTVIVRQGRMERAEPVILEADFGGAEGSLTGIRPEPQGPQANVRLRILHKASGLALSAMERPGEQGLTLVLPQKEDPLQAWRIKEDPRGGFTLVSEATGLVAGTATDEPMPGAALVLAEPNGQPGRLWAAKNEPGGGVLFVSVGAPLCFQPAEPREGAIVRLEEVRRTEIQHWSIEPIDSTVAMDDKTGSAAPSADEAALKPATPATADKSTGKLAALATKKLAVAPLATANKDITSETLVTVQDFLIHAFVNYSRMTVLDRSSVDKLLDELQFQISDLSDTAKAIQVGKLAGAEAIVVGNLNMIGGKYYLTVKLVSVSSGEILASAVGEGADMASFLEMCTNAVKGM
jgi:TolB-like protein